MAAEMSSAMAQLNDITECCICLKTFTDPRMLPCIHTFCFKCLQDMVDKSNKKPKDALPCPVCRKEFTVPTDGVQGIHTNFFMAGMIEVRNALNQSKMGAVPCDICKENSDSPTGKIPEATSRCLVCQENLCQNCCKMHKTFKVSKNHEILKIRGDVGEDEIVKSIQMMNCDIHRGKVLDYYCAECKKVVCVSCFVESHRNHDCKDVNTVEEEFRKIINSSAHMISSLADEVLSKKNKSESKEKFLKKVVEKEKEIWQRSTELMEMIDKQTNSLLSSLDEIKNRHLKEIQTEEDEIDRRLTILESFSKYCDELRSKGSASDVCRSKDELLRRAEELEEDHETYIMRPRVSFDITFQATDLDDFLQSTNGNIIGCVKENFEQLEDFVVAFGGADDSVDLYRIKLHGHGEIASPLQSLPTEVKSYAAAAVYNNNLFITGVGILLDEIWKYSFGSGWKKCGSLVQSRQLHCAEFIVETLYICGGSDEEIVLDSIEAYNALTEKTTIVGQLRVSLKGSASVAYKGSIYVFGGLDKDRESFDCVQVFDPVGCTCTLLSTSMPQPAGWLRAVLWNTYAILQARDACFIFDFETKTWQDRKQFTPYADVLFFGMVLENERIFITGGVFDEADAHGNIQTKCKDDVKYIRASSIVNNEAAKCKAYGQLPKPIGVMASAKLSLAK